MNLLINLTTLKKGGGQNVALNFLQSLNTEGKLGNFTYAVVKNSAIHSFLERNSVKKIIFMPKNPIFRILTEFFLGHTIVSKNKINIIYTYFGIGLYPKKILQVSGSADSNIYFPEIDFWSDYKGIKAIIKKIIDLYRIWGLKRMTAVIFENKVMEERSKEIFGLKETIFIMPSINSSFHKEKSEQSFCSQKKIFKGLFFCGWQKNKNYMLIPELAAELKKQNQNFEFIFTAPKDFSNEHLEFLEKLKVFDVENNVRLIGTVDKKDIPSLYDEIDFVFLLSKLESFSNNIIEAWYFEKALMISDELWSKSICEDAAIYVDRNNVKDIASSICDLIKNENMYDNLIKKGKERISTYPTIKERTEQELNYLYKIYESN